jgi:hypothetical protein
MSYPEAIFFFIFISHCFKGQQQQEEKENANITGAKTGIDKKIAYFFLPSVIV